MEHNQTQIIVKGLTEEIDEKELRFKFEKFGDIKDVNMKSGFCFIEFANDYSAKEAIEKMNNEYIESCKVTVEIAEGRRFEQREESREKDFGNGHHMGGRGGGNFERRGGGDRRQPGPNDTCHNCQERGHFAFNCKNEKKPR